MADGRHHLRETRFQKVLAAIKRRWYYLASGGVMLAAVVVALWASNWYGPQVPAPAASAPPATTAPPATAPVVPPTTPIPHPETPVEVYLVELREAGVELSDKEQTIAVRIADEHVTHGHLVGMREIIRKDFRERIPRLTEEEVEICKTAVEHYFLDVTGRRQ